MTGEVLSFVTSMVRLEMVASVLLLAIAVAVVAALGSFAWFVITKLPGIMREWLNGFNAAVEKLACSVMKITTDVTGTHANTTAANLILAAQDEQLRQIRKNTEKALDGIATLTVTVAEVSTVLENRPCIAKK